MIQSPFNDVKPVDDIFKEEFKKGIRAKLKQNKHILFELLKTDLPLTHYYVQGMVVKNKSEHQWQLDEIERIRDFCHKRMFEQNTFISQSTSLLGVVRNIIIYLIYSSIYCIY